jgi:hypothetical protein
MVALNRLLGKFILPPIITVAPVMDVVTTFVTFIVDIFVASIDWDRVTLLVIPSIIIG